MAKLKKKTISVVPVKLLILIGKPFYVVLSYLIIGVLTFLYLIGNRTRIFAEKTFARVKKLTKSTKKKAHSKKKGKKFKLSKFTFPKVSFTFPIFSFLEVYSFLRNAVPFKKTSSAKNRSLKKRSATSRLSLPKIIFLSKFIINKKAKVGAVILFFLFSFSFLIWNGIFRGLPTSRELMSRKIQVSTKILDRNGQLLYEIYKDQNRTPVSLSQVPNEVKAATLASEDADFYNHPGFSVKGIVRALFNDLTKGQLSGGSTITQQLVKNALLTPEKTFLRKVRELIVSLEVEANFSKDQILEMYLNEVSYGGSAYGIQEASRIYFGKDVGEVDLAEAALLAGLPKSPTQYSPHGADPELAIERQREVLKLMFDNGFITKEQLEEARNKKLTFAPSDISIKAPHFVMYIKQQLVDKFGEEMVESGGLTVTTTLDYSIQKMAEGVVKKQIGQLKNYHVSNGAAVVMDPKTGEVLAMVGSEDYFNTKNDGEVNVTTSLQEPGSFVKVINYAYALGHGFTPASVISDTPTKFIVPGQPAYIPVNYDGKFVGNITLRSALAQSRNIPAVKVEESYGVHEMVALGQKMGITTWKDPSLYGLSLTLGGGSAKLIDLARVGSTIANYGVRPPLLSVLRVTDYRGKRLIYGCDSEVCTEEQVITPGVAFLLIDILKDNKARAPEFGFRSALVVSGHPEIAVKTGTSNSFRDNLTIGFSQKYLTAVWVGNNDNSPMNRIASGITGAAPIWNEIMNRLMASEPSIAWEAPDDVISMHVCGYTEWFLKGEKPRVNCNLNNTAKANGGIKKEDILDGISTTR